MSEYWNPWSTPEHQYTTLPNVEYTEQPVNYGTLPLSNYTYYWNGLVFLPSVITILSIPFNVLEVPEDTCGEESGADIDTAKGIIRLEEQMPTAIKREALLHELIHAADILTAEPKDQLQESDIVRISSVLFSILRDNPQFVWWLMTKEIT
jgi:hypothetical protein